MTLVSIAEASLNLASLIALARGGEEVIIAEGAIPLVRLAMPVKEISNGNATITKDTESYLPSAEEILEIYDMTVEEFKEFIRENPDYAPPKPVEKRVIGMYEGQIWMSDDFDAPMEEFAEYM
jgi:antitoxin (DNA-binding transcriptional repressor) of toxin-antitoxin stability system